MVASRAWKEQMKNDKSVMATGGTTNDITFEQYKGLSNNNFIPHDCVVLGGVWVDSYRKKNGTKVDGYCRRK